jgi:hypothetical protein
VFKVTPPGGWIASSRALQSPASIPLSMIFEARALSGYSSTQGPRTHSLHAHWSSHWGSRWHPLASSR